jgi:hypothetical protein
VLGADASISVLREYESWISERYYRAFESTVKLDIDASNITGDIPSRHRLDLRRYGATEVVFELDWVFPGDGALLWRNLVRIAGFPNNCAVEHRVEVSSSEYVLMPASYSVGSPGVIRKLWQRDVRVGEIKVKSTVYRLHELNVDWFVTFLEAERRCLPLVLITPYANGDRNEADANSIASRLAGVAVVYEADTPQTTWLLSQRLARLGCYDGGIRVYWPRFTLSDDLRSHPLMLGDRVAILGPKRASEIIERSIFAVAAFRFTPHPRIAEIITQSETAARMARVQEAVSSGGSSWEEVANGFAQMNDRLSARLEELISENANLRDNQTALFTSFESTDEIDDEQQVLLQVDPRSVRDAVDIAERHFQYLLFLDNSKDSADKSPFLRPHEVYNALWKMNTVASVWAKNNGGGDLITMLRTAGVGKRVSGFISQTSKGKWGKEYTFIYNRKPQMFESHVTLGSGDANTCASIHFFHDQDRGKLVIGHVGRHLTNTRA